MLKKLFFVFLLTLIVISGSCGPTPVIETVDSFMIAYVEKNTHRLRIRYAGENPTAEWIEGVAIDGGIYSFDQYVGTGLGSHHQGTIAVLGTFTGNVIEVRLGIGPSFSREPEDILAYPAQSSPAITHIDGSEYMIAYQAFDPLWDFINGRLKIVLWDTSHSSVISDDISQMSPIAGNQNPNDNHLVGRPAIAYLQDKQLLLVVWNRVEPTSDDPFATTPKTLYYALGTYPSTDNSENAIVNWTRYGIIDVLEWGESIVASPSLATDGESFYLGIPFGVSEPDVSTSFWMAVYKSTDGLHWTRVGLMQCPNPTYYADIALQPNGDMLVGCMGYSRQDFYLFQDGVWIDLDETKILGGLPDTIGDNQHDFAIETFKLQVN